MNKFRVAPQIALAENFNEFCDEFNLGSEDLILTNPSYFNDKMKVKSNGASVVFLKKYGTGEPTDIMVESLYKDICNLSFKRVIAIGGGSIIDVAKLLVQETVLPLEDLFDKKIATKKVKDLIIIPTTCGTGSEVTSVSVIDMTCKGSKLGLQTDEEYADYAVLIPELLIDLPYKFFATSSLDALIHAVESYLSPKATSFSKMFSKEAIRIILGGYVLLIKNGVDYRKAIIKDYLIASTYAGIAFGNAGCAAVHAMSMPFSGAHHVPHGEANYSIFLEVLKTYEKKGAGEKITALKIIISEVLECDAVDAFSELHKVLECILIRKPLREYGVTMQEIPMFVDTVLNKQGRLTANNCIPLEAEDYLMIYKNLY